MKTVDIHSASLPGCVAEAKAHQVLLTDEGRPVAIIYGLQDFDDEQLERCGEASFWELIQQRRQQSIVTRQELEQSLAAPQS